jgi:ATP-dependent helicase YprA (DUF1998 family)
VRAGLRTLAFVRSRASAERLYEGALELVTAEQRPQLACYRAGYAEM